MKSNPTAVLGLTVLLASSLMGAESFVPDGRVNPDDYTVLMAVDAPLPVGGKRFQAGSHGKFFVEGWTRPDQAFGWEIAVPADDAYAVKPAYQKLVADLFAGIFA